MSSPCLLTGFSSCSPWTWNFTLCTSCPFLSPALSMPTPSKQQQDPMVETSYTGLYSQINSQHGRDPLRCIPGSREGIVGALQYLTYSSPWLQFHVLSQDLIELQFLLLDAKIVFKYLKLQLRGFILTSFSCSQQWFHGCYRLGQASNRRWGMQVLGAGLRDCSMCSALYHTLCCATSLSELKTGSQQMVKGNHWQAHGKTNQRKGRWELRSSTDCLQVKGMLPTRHKASGIGNLKP